MYPEFTWNDSRGVFCHTLSVIPFDDIVGDLMQVLAGRAKFFERPNGVLIKLLRHLLGAFETEQIGISRFVAGDVRALWLADGFCSPLDIEDVVLHLEGKADAACVIVQPYQGVSVDVCSSQCAQAYAGADQCTGLVQMH